jgi:enoyl-CoA hydratase/carnithine racemase
VSGELIGVRHEQRVSAITLQRAEKLNALSTALEGELLAALAEARG